MSKALGNLDFGREKSSNGGESQDDQDDKADDAQQPGGHELPPFSIADRENDHHRQRQSDPEPDPSRVATHEDRRGDR